MEVKDKVGKIHYELFDGKSACRSKVAIDSGSKLTKKSEEVTCLYCRRFIKDVS